MDFGKFSNQIFFITQLTSTNNYIRLSKLRLAQFRYLWWAPHCINYVRPITILTNHGSYDGELCPSSSTPTDTISWHPLISYESTSTKCTRVILFISAILVFLSENLIIYIQFKLKWSNSNNIKSNSISENNIKTIHYNSSKLICVNIQLYLWLRSRGLQNYLLQFINSVGIYSYLEFVFAHHYCVLIHLM